MDITTLGFLKNHIGSNSISHKVVDALPPYGEMGVVYFLKKTNGTYTKYMYNDRAWEKIEESSTLSSGGIEVSGAKVGDFLKVKEVDEKGVPTAWETAEIPTGGEWKLIRTVTVPEDITTDTSGVIWRDFAGDGSSGYGFEFDTDQSGEEFDYNELFITYSSCSLVSGTKTSAGALFQSMMNNVVYWSSYNTTLPLFVAKAGSTTDGWVQITDIKGTSRHCVFGSYKEGFSTPLPNVQTWREPVTAIKAYNGSIKAVCLMVSSVLGFAPGSKFTFYGRK